jgi:hypothetical protein
MSQHKWWDDQWYLQGFGLKSRSDHTYDATHFYHQISNTSLMIDNEAFQDRGMMPADVLDEFENYEKSRPDYVHRGPTNEELRYPSVRNAWTEFLVIRKLAIGK